MRQKNWKYQKERAKFDFDEYLRLEKDKQYTITIKHPEIVKKPAGSILKSVFQGTTTEVDGEKSEKIVIIKNYNNVEFLRKKISGKKEITLEITRHYDDEEMETYFDLKVVRKKVKNEEDS